MDATCDWICRFESTDTIRFIGILYKHGVINTISVIAAIVAAALVWKSIQNAKAIMLKNRKAEMYFNIREYYLDYLKDISAVADFQMLEIDLNTLTENGLDKKEFVVLYKIPLLIERVFEYNSLFDQSKEIKNWNPWVKTAYRAKSFLSFGMRRNIYSLKMLNLLRL